MSKQQQATGSSNQVFSVVDRGRRRERTSDLVYDQLHEAIRSLRLLPGESLSVSDLAQELGVSRTPIREALALLTTAGLVEVVPQVGTTVSLIRMAEVDEARFVRENLEVAALKTAVPLREEDTTELRGILDNQSAALDSGRFDEFFNLDEAFHKQIFVLSGYPGAWEAVQRMKVQLDRLRRLSLPDSHVIAELIREHTTIVDALASGDIHSGEDHVRAHANRAMLLAPELREKHPDYFA